MRPFVYARADSTQAAIETHRTAPVEATSVQPRSQYLAGGTTLIDLMRLDVMRPELVTDINALERTAAGRIELGPRGLWLGALVRMSSAAAHPDAASNFPVIAQSLRLAASAQLRNMASLGGNVLQRTRCTYFRDVSYAACNKRNPGAGCAALDGVNRRHAVLGVSGHCIATYPGDFAQALMALDALVDIAGLYGARRIAFAQLHRRPDDSPHIETTLQPGELITGFVVPPLPWARRSTFLKVRDRESYEFALAAAAVALDLAEGTVREARIALGGVATVPWRARDAEDALAGQPLTDAVLEAAAERAFAGAAPRGENAFKVELGKRTLVRALRQAAAMELPT
ncbi:MAG TPA: xanthine dehydrogenase family protein subunit M [Xanthobacteraceae bacterium]|jgi:xanthine dehydrogenase YagS FAD-binding subunit